MTNIRELAGTTGYSREAIRLRVQKFGLPEKFHGKDVVDLKPLDEKQKQRITLEEARTEETIQSTELKRIQRERLESELAPVDELKAEESRLLEGIAAIIRSSPLEDTRKEDIFSAINDHLDTWENQ